MAADFGAHLARACSDADEKENRRTQVSDGKRLKN